MKPPTPGIGRKSSGAFVLLLSAAIGIARASESAPPDTLLKAMKDELERSVELKAESLERPYFIAYRLADTRFLEIEATLGALLWAPEISRLRWLKPEVRVGSYALDNSEFFGGRSFFQSRGFGRSVAIDDDYSALRHDIWLATDEVYKQALEQYAEKRAALKNRVEAEQVPDFTREAVTEGVREAEVPEIDVAKWQEIIRRLSVIFRGFPGIQESSVRLRLSLGNKYLINSEGTVIRHRAGSVVLSARAAAQASDGMPLTHFVAFHAKSLDELPPEKEMAAGIRGVAEELTRLSSAGVSEAYSGPVLFSGQAAAELFLQLLAPQLSGHRPPVFERDEMAAAVPKSDLADRLNRPVLPSFLSAVDDPTQKVFRGVPLFGGYPFDDQGVVAAPVTLIENGVLKTLLMSRRPRKEIARSNGHGRMLMQGAAGAVIGNLFVRAADEKAIADPKAELIRRCREQGLAFGLLIRVLDEPGLSGSHSFSSFSPRAFSSRESLTSPLVAYKVSLQDGREELVRGLAPGEISLRNLKDIAAAGGDYFVHNRTVGGGGMMELMAGFFGGEDGGAGIPVTVVAPSVLFAELDFKRAPASQQKLPLLANPLASKTAAR